MIGVKASITNITNNFAKMSDSKRNCYLNIGTDSSYSRNKCRMENALELAKATCKCHPWFIPGDGTVCDPNGFTCFDNTTTSYLNKNDEDCLQECVSTEYDLTFGEISDLRNLKNSFGEDWKNYLSDDSPLYFASAKGPNKYGMVHVNFIKKDATVIMKDAKVTFADMVGNIGGTLGVFIGLSFVGLLDFFIWVWESVKGMWSFNK